MKIVFLRSPYTIEISESGQDGSKLELFIWNKGTTEPVTANYTFSKNIPSPTQIQTYYNVSPFVKEFINFLEIPTITTPTVADNNHWVNFKIKRYKVIAGVDTLLDTTSYVGLNGYTNYLNGYNGMIDSTYYLCGITSNKIQSLTAQVPFYNFLVERHATDDFNTKHYNSAGTLVATNTFLTAGATEIFNYCLPFDSGTDAVRVRICRGASVLYTVDFERLEDYKYDSMRISYVNAKGGWQTLTFFAKSSETISIKSNESKLNSDTPNYDVASGQTRQYNINGTTTLKANTGWVVEGYNTFLAEMMLSEKILLNEYIPVKLKSKQFDLKTVINDKMINYEFEFEYDYNLINDVL